MYVVDTGNDRIEELSSSGRVLATWGAAGSTQGKFLQPQGIAVDSSGNVYVTDTGNNRIQKFAPAS
jgi:DNA-binding beta-propeller fold protein YncE